MYTLTHNNIFIVIHSILFNVYKYIYIYIYTKIYLYLYYFFKLLYICIYILLYCSTTLTRAALTPAIAVGTTAMNRSAASASGSATWTKMAALQANKLQQPEKTLHHLVEYSVSQSFTIVYKNVYRYINIYIYILYI